MYSIDIKNLALHVYSIFNSLRKTAIILNVSHTTIARWLKQTEKKSYKRSSNKSDLIVDVIRTTITANPYISLRSFTQVIKTTLNIQVSKELVRIVIKRLGFSLKKAKVFLSPKDLNLKIRDFINKRDSFLQQERYIVSMDETSFGRYGKPVYGYSLKGKPLIQYKNVSKQGKSTSVLAVVDKNGLVTKEHVLGAYNTIRFASFLEQLDLPNQTVILLDNVRFHHSIISKQIAQRKGWELLYTPPYSPRFNPIEEVFSIVKRQYYKHWDIENAFRSLDSKHCNAFFNHAMKMI